MTPPMSEYLDIPYPAPWGLPLHPLHSFDLYVAPSSAEAPAGTRTQLTPAPTTPPPPPPLLCFVHGGAWRSEDKRDYGVLARSLAAYTSCTVAVPNYRLTQPPGGDNDSHQPQHPAHAQDVLQLLTFLLSWSGPHQGSRVQFQSSPPYDPNRIFLVGHSCSAHMLACILLDSSEAALVPSAALLRAVRGVVFSEGIYDIDTLLRSNPTYRNWFIRDTFGGLPTYDRYSVTRMTLREEMDHIRWLILHSKGDTLVDSVQSQAMYDHLQALYEGGLRDAYQVLRNWDDLEGEHNAILQSAKYIQILGDFIRIVLSA